MPVSLSIEPFSPCIDMYDSPDTAASYSLSGHVLVLLTPSASLLGRTAPPQDMLLTALEITFEGQTELVLTDVGYTPLRLITVTKQLVPADSPVHIGADDAVRIVFDISVPGWLPQSAIFGDEQPDSGGVAYALYARARLDEAVVPAAPAASGVWSNLCAAVRLAVPPRPHTLHAPSVPITLTRFVSPRTYPHAAFAIHAVPESHATHIPAEILRTVELHAIVPTRTSLADAAVPLVLRIRTATEIEDSPLRILSFHADVVQVDTFHTSPSANYTRFPLPPPTQQPPSNPLKSPHPIAGLLAAGLISPPSPQTLIPRESTLCPPAAPHLFRVRGADSRAPGVPLSTAWLRITAPVPIVPGDASPTAASESPFRTVRHELRIRLSLGFDPDPDVRPPASDELAFSVPFEFVRMGPPPGVSTSAAHSRAATPAHTPTPAPSLPAYTQLFHANGDRKDDTDIAGSLPLYREKDPASDPDSDSEADSESGTSSSGAGAMTPPDSPGPEVARRKFGESFLALGNDDENENDADDEADGEDVQYGIAI